MRRPARLPLKRVVVGCAAAALLLGGCAGTTPAAPPMLPAEPAVPAVPVVPAVPSRCEEVIPEQVVRGLLGGVPEVGGGKPRVTGSVTSTRCDWLAPNGRYLTIITLEGPGLPARTRTVTAGATPVPGRPGISYDPARGLLVTVADRLHQVVAGGAGTAAARVIGLKAVEAIRAARG